MVEWVKRLLWDESAFVRYARATLFAAAMAMPAFKSGEPVDWMAVATAFVAGLMGAGEKNGKPA
ncbi:MAG: hypothetical protein AB7I42_22710 [Bradyrhizobium sp.]|uniref:hypothetical protein n=1 Tax=Bradyrhizobium sp. TaxID=376 RepID=UPI003D122CC7